MVRRTTLGWVLAIPATMVLVAALHATRVSTTHTSPWVGAGFGMFATVDGHHRVVRLDDASGRPVAMPPALRPAARQLANDPSEARLESALDGAPGADRITVLRPVFDPDSDSLSWTVVASLDRP